MKHCRKSERKLNKINELFIVHDMDMDVLQPECLVHCIAFLWAAELDVSDGLSWPCD